LVVEPNQLFKGIIFEEISHSKADSVEVVCVSQAQDLLLSIKDHDLLPELMIVEWYACGDQIRACLDGLRNLAVLHRIRVVAIAGPSARKALAEAQSLGVRRFVCKLPDEASFRKKMGEAINEFLPTESKRSAAAV